MNDQNDSPKNQRSEKILSWILSGLGVALLGIGAVGYFIQDSGPETVPAPPTPKSADIVAPPINAQSPILFITIDNLSGDMPKEMKANPNLAPNLKSLMDTSTVFTRAYSASAVPMSAAASVMTGTYPSAHQYFWLPWYTLANGKKVPEAMTIAFPSFVRNLSQLMPHYETGAWVSNWWLSRNTGIMPTWKKSFTNFRITAQKDHVATSSEPVVKDFLVNSKGSAPFRFNWVNLNDLEIPFSVSPEAAKRFVTKGVAMPTAGQLQSFKYLLDLGTAAQLPGSKKFPLQRALYLAAVNQLDANLGELLKGLKERGEFDQTTIILVGSSGYSVQPAEGTMLDQVRKLHVPLFIKKPQQKRTETVSIPVSSVSVAPTIRELAGYPAATQFQAPSLVPALKGNPGAPRLVFAETLSAETRQLFMTEGDVTTLCEDDFERYKVDKGTSLFCYWVADNKKVDWMQLTELQRKKIIEMKNETYLQLRAGGDPFAIHKLAQ
jgi:hypothetical protein